MRSARTAETVTSALEPRRHCTVIADAILAHVQDAKAVCALAGLIALATVCAALLAGVLT